MSCLCPWGSHQENKINSKTRMCLYLEQETSSAIRLPVLNSGDNPFLPSVRFDSKFIIWILYEKMDDPLIFHVWFCVRLLFFFSLSFVFVNFLPYFRQPMQRRRNYRTWPTHCCSRRPPNGLIRRSRWPTQMSSDFLNRLPLRCLL